MRTPKLITAAIVVVLLSAGSCDTKPPADPITTRTALSPIIGDPCTLEEVGKKTIASDGKTVVKCSEPRPYKWRVSS